MQQDVRTSGSAQRRTKMRAYLSSKKVVSLLWLGIAILVGTLSAFAQSTAGRILGSVSDQTGAALKGATVVITDVERGTSRSLTTDEGGEYVAPDLPPSTYKVRVEANGFRAVEHTSVSVEVAQDVRLDFSLQPGQVAETITVNVDVPLVN